MIALGRSKSPLTALRSHAAFEELASSVSRVDISTFRCVLSAQNDRRPVKTLSGKYTRGR